MKYSNLFVMAHSHQFPGSHAHWQPLKMFREKTPLSLFHMKVAVSGFPVMLFCTFIHSKLCINPN
jgi:hypothetical protein